MIDFTSVWEWGVQWIYKILPLSPFKPYLAQMADLPYLGYLNWFFPVGPCLTVLSAWLLAYGAYLGYSIIARWAKVIE